jgi:hypothetical protein
MRAWSPTTKVRADGAGKNHVDGAGKETNTAMGRVDRGGRCGDGPRMNRMDPKGKKMDHG